MPTPRRDRSRLLLRMTILVALGLGSRLAVMPDFIVLYAGDILWGAFFFVLAGCLWPGAAPLRLWSGAVLVTELIEASQMCRASWLLQLRATALGSLMLGHEFLWSDVFCVATGATAALLLETSASSGWRCLERQAATSVPVPIWIALGMNVVAAAVVVYGWDLLRPPPGLKAGDTYYGGPGDGFVMGLLITLPFSLCQLGNIVGIAYTVHSLLRKRGFWAVVACIAAAMLWISVLTYIEHDRSGVVRLGG